MKNRGSIQNSGEHSIFQRTIFRQEKLLGPHWNMPPTLEHLGFLESDKIAVCIKLEYHTFWRSSMVQNEKEQNTWKPLTIFALLTVYFVWGSTYLAIRIGLESFPPYLMIGARFILAGAIVYAYLRIRKMSNPASVQWKNAALVGVLMLGGGVGNTAFAEQYVSSGIAAIGIATVPLWAAIFAGFFGQSPTRAEWFGLL